MESFTPIVIMMTNVIYDLRIFGLFYTILIFIFSLMFSVLGIGLDKVQNLELADAEATRRRVLTRYDTFRELKPKASSGNSLPINDLIPSEYKYLGMFIG